jgi:phosphohistidine swiveling domain-containing protein/thymidylate kinase
VERIGGFPVAVRSSATFEDLETASFAGQYQTFLHVSDITSLRLRIADCRASSGDDRVASYSSRSGHDPATADVAVLVQRQIEARTAGVSFTIDPLTGIEDFAVVEYCQGLGDQLVSGRVTGDRLAVRLRDGAVVDRSTSGAAALTDAEVTALNSLMLAVQAHRHRPQDLEWAIDNDGKLWLLQARPITSISWRTDIGQHTDADFRDGGVSARVCTPMMYSLYRNAFQSTMQNFFVGLGLQQRSTKPEWIACYYGRPYWNVAAVKQCFLKVPGWNEQDFDADLGVNKDYGDDGPARVPVTPATVARALPVAFASLRLRRRALAAAKRFAKRWNTRHTTWRERAAAVSEASDTVFAQQLRECLLAFHPATERTYFNLIYNNTVLQSDLKRLIQKVDDATGRTTPMIDLMGGLAEITHMDMQRGMVELYHIGRDRGLAGPHWDDALRNFLEHHGFHSDIELELTCPRWSEDPGRVRDMIQTMLAGGAEPANPDLGVELQRQRYQDALADIRGRIGAHPLVRLRYGRAIGRMVDVARQYLVARERMRQFSAQCYAIVRAYVVEAGARLASRGVIARPDDVFMLSAPELADLVDAAAPACTDLLDTIGFRRAMYDGYRDLQPPHELGAGIGPVSNDFDGNALHGLGCSPGTVEGVARVVHSLRDINVLGPGDILVTEYTDPGWTPALGLVAGVITEVGGMLSHAAVIGREYGIPAVLNVAGATSAIQTGQRVRIDGRAGTVEIVDNAQPLSADRGKRIVCVTGGDGAGKSTQIAAVIQALARTGQAACEVTIWDALSDDTMRDRIPFESRADVYRYLELLTPTSRIHFLFHALQLAIDLAAAKGADILLLNGHWYKYLATEAAHGGDPHVLRALTAGFPEPDQTFYLSITPAEALNRKTRRSDYESGYGDEAEFIEFQRRSRQVLDDLATELGWTQLDGTACPDQLTEAILKGMAEEGPR